MKTWFITGVSRGFGRSLAEAALERGDTVLGTVRSGPCDLSPGNGVLHVLPLDIADPGAIEAIAPRAFGLVDRIDVVVNNAGYGLFGAVEDVADDELEHVFAINVFGPVRLIRALLPRLRQEGSGHVINITSVAGRDPNEAYGLYAATKAAMDAVSQSLAREVGPLGIKVTAVAPGSFRTDFLSSRSARRSSSTGTGRAYAETVGEAMARFEANDGRQIGDPARAAAAILTLVDADHAPQRLLLGSDALRRARGNLDVMVEEMATWEPVSLGTDFATSADTDGREHVAAD